MFEIDEAARMITESCDPNANIIFGTSIDEKYTGEIKVTVIATGFSEETNAQLGGMSRGGFGTSSIFQQRSPAPSNNNFSQNRGGSQTSMSAPAPIPENDYDVPAFLRNKMPKN
jgi:cell division protein FtsZ